MTPEILTERHPRSWLGLAKKSTGGAAYYLPAGRYRLPLVIGDHHRRADLPLVRLVPAAARKLAGGAP